MTLKRRQFIAGLGAAAAWPLGARAQQKLPVIGYLSTLSADTSEHSTQLSAFLKGLGTTDYVVGQNVEIEFRWADGHYDRMPDMAADLVRRPVDVIFATGGSAPALAAKAATTTIPIVFSSGGDPVAGGLVASLNRPGGNVTGVSLMFSDLSAKRLGLLHELIPGAAVIGVLVNPDYPDVDSQIRQLKEAASTLGHRLLFENARTEGEIAAAFEIIVQGGAAAVLVASDPFFSVHRDQLVELAARHAIPAVYYDRESADAGGLMSYGPDYAEAYLQGGIDVGRILHGAKPADLPVVLPTKFLVVINLRTARTLKLTIPPGVLAIADQVIE